MLTTRTGNFPIGFRRGGGEWQKNIADAIAWAKANEIGVMDVGRSAEETKAVTDAGLHVGSADLLAWNELMSPDQQKRDDAVARNGEYVAAASAAGAQKFFFVALPENPDAPRRDNFALLVESLNALTPALEKHGAQIVIEGWPGPGALVCTPEGYRTVLKECASPTIGINYDPSHLIRMGIDPLRFVHEFADRAGHVHGKDTELMSDELYEYGHEQEPTFGAARGFGGMHWRYTIPGHGQMRWTRGFEILRDANYDGAVSIELEDANFNGTDDGEKRGILLGAQFLSSC